MMDPADAAEADEKCSPADVTSAQGSTDGDTATAPVPDEPLPEASVDEAEKIQSEEHATVEEKAPKPASSDESEPLVTEASPVEDTPVTGGLPVAASPSTTPVTGGLPVAAPPSTTPVTGGLPVAAPPSTTPVTGGLPVAAPPSTTPVTGGLPVAAPPSTLRGPAVTSPPAVVPPKGLSGIFDDYDPNAILDTSQFPPNMVFCNVYDVGDREDELLQRVNHVGTGNNNFLLGGIFHAGLEVYGIEWCYGASDAGLTGIAHILPRTNQQHAYRCTVPLGVTARSDSEVRNLLQRMAPEWPGSKYHLLHCNCLTFCSALCEELGVRHIPGWIDRVGRTASFIERHSRSAADNVRKTAQLARTVSRDVEERAFSFGTEFERTVSAEAEEAQNFIDDTIEAVRRESLKVVEVAKANLPRPDEFGERAQELGETAQAHAQALGEKMRAHTQELGEKAQALIPEEISEKAQELGEKAQAQAQVLTETVRAGARDIGETFGERAQELQSKAQELLGEDITERAQELHGKAQEFHGKAQEQAQALGESLWRWGADLQKAAAKALGDEPAASRGRAAPRDPWGVLPAGGVFVGSGELWPMGGATAEQQAEGSSFNPPPRTEASASSERGTASGSASSSLSSTSAVAVEDQE